MEILKNKNYKKILFACILANLSLETTSAFGYEFSSNGNNFYNYYQNKKNDSLNKGLLDLLNLMRNNDNKLKDDSNYNKDSYYGKRKENPRSSYNDYYFMPNRYSRRTEIPKKENYTNYDEYSYDKNDRKIEITNNNRLHSYSYNWINQRNKETRDRINKEAENFKGKNVWIGILDSNFEKFQSEPAISRYVKESFIGQISNTRQNNSEHGLHVLEFMTKDTDFNVIAGSIGTASNGVSYSALDYEKLFKTFLDKKQTVKIVNQSFGSTSKDDYNPRIEGIALENYQIERNRIWIDIYKNYINNNRALFVIANGNTAEYSNATLENGGVQTQYPIVEKELLKGWISVVGIDGRTNKHFSGFSHLAYPGVAKDWAISADGFRNTTRRGNYIYIDYGSSYAAPNVSRTAGLILSKYPWMKNSQIRETLFTTTNKADHLGNNENDRQNTQDTSNQYGWGIMNTTRALKGPGAFWQKLLEVDGRNYHNKDGKYYFTADISKGGFYFDNNIVGDSGLIKSGKGSLGLTGKNTYIGKTLVKDGILEIYGSQASDIEIEKNVPTNEEGILILGNNAETKNIDNSGVLVVQEKAKIDGNYNAKNSSDTVINIDRNTLLTVTGNTKFENDAMLTLETWAYPTQNNYTIIKSNNRVDGINKTTITGMRTATLTLTDTEVKVNIQRKNATAHTLSNESSVVSTAGNVEEVLSGIDYRVANNTATAYDLAMGKSLINKSAREFSAAGQKMTGEIYASAQNMSFIQAQNTNRTLSNHLSSLDDFKNMQAWVLSFGSKGKLKENGFATADTKVIGGQFGIDKRINNNTVIGGGINYSYGKLNFDRDAGKTNSDSVGFSIYGKQNMKYDTYALARLGFNRFSNRTQRELIDINGDVVLGDTKHHDKMLSSYFEFGKTFGLITPYIAYSKDYLERGKFKENNTTWGLVADKKNYEKENIHLGIRVQERFNKIKLDTYIEHIINVGNRNLDFKAKFIGSNGNQQTFRGIEQEKNMTYVGIGATYDITENFNAKLNLDVRFKEKKNLENLASVRFNYKF